MQATYQQTLLCPVEEGLSPVKKISLTKNTHNKKQNNASYNCKVQYV